MFERQLDWIGRRFGSSRWTGSARGSSRASRSAPPRPSPSTTATRHVRARVPVLKRKGIPARRLRRQRLDRTRGALYRPALSSAHARLAPGAGLVDLGVMTAEQSTGVERAVRRAAARPDEPAARRPRAGDRGARAQDRHGPARRSAAAGLDDARRDAARPPAWWARRAHACSRAGSGESGDRRRAPGSGRLRTAIKHFAYPDGAFSAETVGRWRGRVTASRTRPATTATGAIRC